LLASRWLVAHELDDRHGCVVANAGPNLDDAGVATWTITETLSQVNEYLFQNVDALSLVAILGFGKALEELGQLPLRGKTPGAIGHA
jgi:hypothetical protein